MSAEELRRQLESLQRSHDALLRSITQSNGSFGPSQEGHLRRASTRDDRHVNNTVFADSSTLSDDSDEEDESYFVQENLPTQTFDHEHLREHLKTHDWTEHGREILSNLFLDRGRLKDPSLFPQKPGPADDRSHYSHFQVYDVGPDGAVEAIENSGKENMSRANEIFHSIKDIGVGNSKVEKTVGRITIAREPSPILFGALHLTMNNTFDMDELFKYLVTTDACSAHMNRAFYQEERRQKTFFFNFEYYTIIGEDCRPMDWQFADREKRTMIAGHVPITRCSAVVALALYDDKPRRVRNKGRRAKTQYGLIQNIWSPWQVLVIECFPDWRATPDTFESGHRYLNGPEAFLRALLTEYRDARKRYESLYKSITNLIIPSLGFIFDGEERDRRLFEDKDFTWTRRYFWAHQTFGNINDSIKSMIDAFEDTFTEDVWEGKSNTVWPLFEESPRNDHWKKKLRLIRLQFEHEMRELRILIKENNDRRAEIRTLQDHLFSGTSIQESRKSVELTDITVQQGRNIKLLTLVNMIFVPLTFVTSVYGMTNMETNPAFWKFGVTLTTVCIPFFLLIGFLNTDSGYKLWMEKSMAIWHWIKYKSRSKSQNKGEDDDEAEPSPVSRSWTAEEGRRLRMGSGSRPDSRQGQSHARGKSDASATHPNIRRIVEAMGEGKQSGLMRMGTVNAGADGSIAETSQDTKEHGPNDAILEIDERK